jgi:hypothetical protein
MRTEYFRALLRMDRVMRNWSSGSTPRIIGDHQPIAGLFEKGKSFALDIGNTPVRYA